MSANVPFRGILSVYTSKNNVSWVLSDVTMSNIYFKVTGGMVSKRGTEKNSSKFIIKNFEKIQQIIKELSFTRMIIYLKKAYGTKAHSATTKGLLKLLSTTDLGMGQIPIYNNTTVARSYVRPKGGRRGRRV